MHRVCATIWLNWSALRSASRLGLQSRNTSTTPMISAAPSLIGAPLSSMGISRPSRARNRVPLASPMTPPHWSTLLTGFSADWRVFSLRITNTVVNGWPMLSAWDQPVRRSASAFNNVIRPA